MTREELKSVKAVFRLQREWNDFVADRIREGDSRVVDSIGHFVDVVFGISYDADSFINAKRIVLSVKLGDLAKDPEEILIGLRKDLVMQLDLGWISDDYDCDLDEREFVYGDFRKAIKDLDTMMDREDQGGR